MRLRAVGPRESGILIPGDAKSCSLVDFSQDGWADLLVSLNNGAIQAYEATPHLEHKIFRVKLAGPNGNLDCVGATVTVQFRDQASQTVEVQAGGGYLSQSTTVLYFGCGLEQPEAVAVRWPDGHSTRHPVPDKQWAMGIRMPSRESQ